MDIDCSKDQNKMVRRDTTSINEMTFYVNDGTREVTNDANHRTYIETDENCVCKAKMN